MTATLRRRLQNALDCHRRRARLAGQALDYGRDELALLVADALAAPCCYCGARLTEASWSCDHKTPTSRHGSHSVWNLQVCCRACNETKGALDDREFRALLACLFDLPERARADVLRRLRAGGRFRR